MLRSKLTNLPFTCFTNALWMAVLITVRDTFPPFDLGMGLGALATLPWQRLYTVSQTVSSPLSWPGWPHWWLHWAWPPSGSGSAVEGGRQTYMCVCPSLYWVCVCVCVCVYPTHLLPPEVPLHSLNVRVKQQCEVMKRGGASEPSC